MKNQQIIFQNKPTPARKPTGKQKNTRPLPVYSESFANTLIKLREHTRKALGIRP